MILFFTIVSNFKVALDFYLVKGSKGLPVTYLQSLTVTVNVHDGHFIPLHEAFNVSV
jgi:hypothetical protein